MDQGQLTSKELASLEELLAMEEAYYQKFSHYSEYAEEPAVKKLSEQLADRSREHFFALNRLLNGKSPLKGGQ